MFGASKVGNVIVHTTSYRPTSLEELSQRAADKIVSISDTAPEPIRIQALAYKERIQAVILFYLQEAAKQHFKGV
jgi:hypothetical protein